MSFQLIHEWYVRSPVQKLVVKAILTSQTDDDWYRLEVCPLDDTDLPGAATYPLKTNRMLRNIGEVKFSRDGLMIVALEFDGHVIIWQQGPTGKFNGTGQVFPIGSPIYGLKIADTGMNFSVHTHPHGILNWFYDSRNGKFVVSD